MYRKHGSAGFLLCIYAFLFCAGLILLIFIVGGFQPFGQRSLVTADANIQYLDFYAYYKTVLAGENSILYSFSKTLGGNCISVFSYYLASPFTLLYTLFPQSSYYLLFNVVTLLKVSLASLTMCLFLQDQFSDSEDRYSGYYTLILSVSYALSQYTIAQCSNSMWLDGVYMLPLLLREISKYVREGQLTGIAIVTAVSILINWYSAGMNCLFAIVWFIVESLEYIGKNSFGTSGNIRRTVRSTALFGLAMLLGVGISSFLFLPTAAALGSGSRGGLQFNRLLGTQLVGNVTTVLKNYTYGAVSAQGSAALYCGTFPLIAVISHLMSKDTLKKKSIILLIFMIVMLYWNPVTILFSLFKPVTSYWYRYSYICILIMIFAAGEYLFHSKKENWKLPLIVGLVSALIYPLLWYGQLSMNVLPVLRTMFLFIGSGLLFSLFLRYSDYFDKAGIILVILCFTDVWINYHMLAVQTYSTEDTSLISYSAEAAEAVEAIQQIDAGEYRISQTETRYMTDDGMTSYYNDAMAYNYRSISGYTSSPDDNQREFLSKLGYRKNGENYNVTNASVISADALLGVKYTLSPYDIRGLQCVSEQKYNGKRIYLNPYALPMSFVYRHNPQALDDSDPFCFQNDLYKQLTGKDKDIFIKLDFSVDRQESGACLHVIIPQGNYSVYGNMPWKKGTAYSRLSVNGSYEIGYSSWGSQSVWYIPYDGAEAVVTITGNDLNIDNYQPEFYALDLDLLNEYTNLLHRHLPVSEDIQNGNIRIDVKDAESGDRLFISVPYDQGWTVQVNGHLAEYDLIGDCLYSVHLYEGENTVTMKYHAPGLNMGIGITAISLCVLFLIMRVSNNKRIVYN